MKLLAYAAPAFAMAFLILVAFFIVGCADKVMQGFAGPNDEFSTGERDYNDTGWTCIGNCNGGKE